MLSESSDDNVIAAKPAAQDAETHEMTTRMDAQMTKDMVKVLNSLVDSGSDRDGYAIVGS